MGKTAKAPSGFYTAKDVMQKLGIANSTLYHYVETGKIKKVVPPGRKEGYYPKAEIDKMIRAKELFILQYATDASFFDKAEESDIEKITELGIEIFGKQGSPNYETRLAQFRANPDIFYILRQEELVVGYLGLFPLKHEAIEAIMSGMEEDRFRTGILNPDNIVQFEPGMAEEVFVIIVTRQNLRRSTSYAARLLNGGIDVLKHMARRGVIIKRLYATSRTNSGTRLARDLGFKQITPPNEEDDLLRFMIDLETSLSPLLKNYRRIVQRVLAKREKRDE
jgi:predicted DNA-binding transcriptional regulator AlpA